MEPKFNVWFEVDGKVAASRWRMRLLEAVAEQGSISAGAETMEVPYRVAWQKIQEMEDRLGDKLIETQTGGPGGGGAQLTEAGRGYVEQFKVFGDRVDTALAAIYREVFGDTPQSWA
ncbi:MAG: LysR family transcriptional regulator [Acidimicrobiia bacterium]|nr:LysR family transcriptional regulator [Acidimicrobiia bacterium]